MYYEVESLIPLLNEEGSVRKRNFAQVPRLANMVYIAFLNERNNIDSLFLSLESLSSILFICLLVLYIFVHSHSHVILQSSQTLSMHTLLLVKLLVLPIHHYVTRTIHETRFSPLFCTS